MIWNSFCDSPAVRDDVGSSMMMMRARSARALAISTICISPTVRLETGVSGGWARPTRCSKLPRPRSASRAGAAG